MVSPKKLKYPRDVVAAFLERDVLFRQFLAEVLNSRGVKGPTSAVLERLIEIAFFASMAKEEGRSEPVGIVFAEDEDFLFGEPSVWEVLHIRSPLRFEVSEVTKLAATCEFRETFLAVMRLGKELKIVGTAMPGPMAIMGFDTLVRVLAPQPGTIWVYRGNTMLVNYEQGHISDPPPAYLSAGSHQRQLISIAKAVRGAHPRLPIDSPERAVFRGLSRVLAGMSRLAHGGIIAILGPEDSSEPLLHGARVLTKALPLGQAIDQQEALTQASFNEVREGNAPTGPQERGADAKHDAWERERAANVSEWLDDVTRTLVRLTAVDGAVLLDHSLQVLAFGVKLAIPHGPRLRVFSVTDKGKPGPRWPLDVRGTRHRAAVAFAKAHPRGLALIVSQDGDAAVLQSIGSKVVYWPLWIR